MWFLNNAVIHIMFDAFDPAVELSKYLRFLLLSLLPVDTEPKITVISSIPPEFSSETSGGSSFAVAWGVLCR